MGQMGLHCVPGRRRGTPNESETGAGAGARVRVRLRVRVCVRVRVRVLMPGTPRAQVCAITRTHNSPCTSVRQHTHARTQPHLHCKIRHRQARIEACEGCGNGEGNGKQGCVGFTSGVKRAWH